MRIASFPHDERLRQASPAVLSWLLEGEPSIRWRVKSDLLSEDPALVESTRREVAGSGWGARFPFPPRWHYGVLRALDYFQRYFRQRTGTETGGRGWESKFDERCADGIAPIERKRQADRRWLAYRGPKGQEYFALEQPGEPGRWYTLRALRVLNWWEGEG